jgi:predicted cupin superfamily sugar epimerase
MINASYWIEKLGLLPHPEGGFYKETYRSEGSIVLDNKKVRPHSTAIYFLMEAANFSAFHRIQSDELWHFYDGDPLEVFYFDKNGLLIRILLGSNPEKGEEMQAVVPAKAWFGSRPCDGSLYSLVGCTVSPGFDFEDFEMAKKNQLLMEYPEHAKIIEELTRD